MMRNPGFHRDAHIAVLAAAGLIVAAWLALTLLLASPYASVLDHRAIGESHLSPVVHTGGFALGWTLMVLAMMLPASLPVLNRLDGGLRRRSQRWRRLAAFAAGYLLAWLAFGLVLYLGDSLLHAAVERFPFLNARLGGIAAAVMLASGLYALSPVGTAWRRGCVKATSRQGIAHALDCIRPCGGWMVLMFAFAGGNLAWMAAVGTVGVVEQNMRWGRGLARLLGAGLVVWAVAGLANLVPLPKAN